mgnify:CR=1 FL=1
MLDIGAGYGLEKRTEENAALVDRARERNKKGVKQLKVYATLIIMMNPTFLPLFP